ncbi:hypothetical protein BV22DRAFT_1073050 [Leucogyrophana mollusca]|uniref:Uncharacterized protein n=1 Tax=Leucogyrophana mollusca TaxID=85980 RepID=A0ACB8B626_9AGAM|nr:hypothetical protein BV22DRAFT_1073050 [Leucogyrophana mollusca]
MDASHFNAAVLQVVSMIPPQRVMSCGHLAKLIGAPRQSRRVSEVVRFLAHTTPSAPWHRVISTAGIIASHGGLGPIQRDALEGEGVSVCNGILGEPRVRFDQWGWFPEHVGLDSDTESDDEWGA